MAMHKINEVVYERIYKFHFRGYLNKSTMGGIVFVNLLASDINFIILLKAVNKLCLGLYDE